MTKTRIFNIPEDFPDDIRRLVGDSKIYDSSCSSDARVYYIEGGGFYLKRAKRESLKSEAVMASYFHKKKLSRAVLHYCSIGQYDWLATEAVVGEDLTSSRYTDDPKRLCDKTSELLRELHETDFSDCPIPDRMESYFSLAKSNYENRIFDPNIFGSGPLAYESADAAWLALNENRGALRSKVLLHGDYCLPNIIFNDWSFSGFIDLGASGVGDRHVDIFWGAWTLNFNLKTDEYRERFYDGYGRELIDEAALRAIAAAEQFG